MDIDYDARKREILTLQCEHAEQLRHAVRLRDIAAPLDELKRAMRHADAIRARINELQRDLGLQRTRELHPH